MRLITGKIIILTIIEQSTVIYYKQVYYPVKCTLKLFKYGTQTPRRRFSINKKKISSCINEAEYGYKNKDG